MKLKIIFLSAVCLLVSIFSQASTSQGSRNFEISKNIDTFIAVIKELDLFHVDSIQPQQLIHSAIRKMLAEFDPHTRFIPESEFETIRFMDTGEFVGIGAIISQRNDQILVVELHENMPAHRSGLRIGDIILEVNGQSLRGKDVADVSSMLRGNPGEIVTVLVERHGVNRPIRKEITRERIQENSVDFYSVFDNIAYIRLSGFTSGASNEVQRVLLEMTLMHNIDGLILDLRGNPGGLIQEAVNIANLFLPRGQVVLSTRSKNEQWNRTHRTTREPLSLEMPIVVLVNENSASGSEVIAGAFQDLDRAVIIGNTTAGKGSVQTTRPIGFGNHLILTTQKYYIPSGRSIQANPRSNERDSIASEYKTANGRTVRGGVGIEPDILLDTTQTFNIAHRLAHEFIIFDFATKFHQNNPQIASPEDFVFTDENFEEFRSFLEARDFRDELRSSLFLQHLKEIVRLEGYSEIAKAELEALALRLQPNTNKDLEQHRQQIIELLSIEIVGRYYFRRGEIIEFLKHDQGLRKAIEILKDRERYNEILSFK